MTNSNSNLPSSELNDDSANVTDNTHKPKCSCQECGDGLDIFGFGDTMDEHMDADESPENMAKRIADAIETARKMAGKIPAELERELGKLLAPQIKWQDTIRAKLIRSREGNSRNDWTRFKSRPLFAGLLIPRKINYTARFICLLDTSGSMSKEDMTFGISQLQALDEKNEGFIVCGDAEIYYDKATKLKKCNAEELYKIKVDGGGGTRYSSFFDDYEKKLGKADFLIVITDGFLLDEDVAAMRNPGIPVYWIITSGTDFDAPFGKVFQLRG